MRNFLKRLYNDECGYGIVELLLIVAGLGLLATTVFHNLNRGIAGGEGSTDSTVDNVINGIDGMITDWNPEP